ncbi:MAG: GNAT family N-acetyltransferase [Novosphingobium sp.]|uniref:GNAT family N-acetyltransferase n=1 Tax=Novosphingobium sp. TaxID=1874826 RepID=UPI00301AF3F5
MTQPLLSTDRLDLWLPAPRDHAGLMAMLADDEVRRHLGSRPTGEVEEFNRLCRNAGSWSLYGYGMFTCRSRGQDAVLGICGVFHSWRGFGQGLDNTPEIGWIFARSTWGQGIATEAARASLAWFNAVHPGRRIGCMINDTNLPSLAVAAKLGFVRYGTHADDETTLILLEHLP